MTKLRSLSILTGDRSTERRDAKKTDTMDYMGTHTQSFDPQNLPQEPLGDIFPIPEEGGMFQDINMTPTTRAQAMGFSAGSDGKWVEAAAGTGFPRGVSASSSLSSPSMTPAAGQRRSSGSSQSPSRVGVPASYSPWEMQQVESNGGAGSPPAAGDEMARLLSRAEIERRDSALRAVGRVQAAAARRAAWNAKASQKHA